MDFNLSYFEKKGISTVINNYQCFFVQRGANIKRCAITVIFQLN